MAIQSGFGAFRPSNLTIADNTTVSDTISMRIIGGWARIVDIQIVLNGLSHTFPDDLDFLLIGRNGAAFEFWSDGGGFNGVNGNYTIADGAALYCTGLRGDSPRHVQAYGL